MESESSETETISGRVERVVYHDPRTRYTVLRLHVPGHETLVTAVGRSTPPDEGGGITMVGRWGQHPQHGVQFEFGQVHLEVPTSVGGIVRRLQRYPGVKAVMAARIVERFGADTLEIIDKQPRRLLEVEGIGAKTLERMLAFHKEQTGPIAQLESLLIELDVPVFLANAIHGRYGERAVNVLQQHPYRLARDVRGIGFATADRIARAQGLDTDSPDRVEAGLVHVLEQAMQDGHCALPIDVLVHKTADALTVPEGTVREAGERLVGMGELVLDFGNNDIPLCFPVLQHDAEVHVAQVLNELAVRAREPWKVPELPEQLSAGQVEAVHAVAEHGVVVLTGGPGTGKSTVVAAILATAQHNGVALHLAAPTGRAAKRLEETTQVEAKTLHRLLEFQPEIGQFARGNATPLDSGLVVVDESSMLDLNLAQALLMALTPEHRLLLVGDADQLPSVGAGNVLADVIEAATDSQTPIRLVRLEQVFRQGEGSSIVTNAHRILHGESPQADRPREGEEQGEFFVVSARSPEHAHDLIVRMATERIPAAYGFDGRTEIQVLCPMHKGRGGTEALNRTLQEFHTNSQREVVVRGGASHRRFRTGDRVMQIRNDYERGVFNGDVGSVVKVDPEQAKVTVDFGGVRATYEGRDTATLQLAYAVSIHKSQGSEFPAVIVSLLPEHHVMLQRNLLYTAVTRAKRLCVIVGDPRAIRRAVERADAGHRHTGLARRLIDAAYDIELDPTEGSGSEPQP